MKLFLDESGTHHGSSVSAVAGYLITDEAIPILEEAWRSVLAEYGLDELHMREFVPPHGKHSNWGELEKRALLERLIALIHEHSLVGVGAALELDGILRASLQNAHSKAPGLVESAYEWCIRYCSVQAALFADRNDLTGQIDHVLDEGCSEKHNAERGFNLNRSDPEIGPRYRLGTIQFLDSKLNSAIQCADLLAYEMYKEAEREISQSPRQTRKSFMALLRDQDRLVTIDPVPVEAQIIRGFNLIEVQVALLPPKERFQVTCYGLRSVSDEQRRHIFDVAPHLEKIYRMCISCGEYGMRLADLPPGIVCYDPKILLPLMGLDPDGAQVGDTDDGRNQSEI